MRPGLPAASQRWRQTDPLRVRQRSSRRDHAVWPVPSAAVRERWTRPAVDDRVGCTTDGPGAAGRLRPGFARCCRPRRLTSRRRPSSPTLIPSSRTNVATTRSRGTRTSDRFLTFDHASASAVLRNRRLGRIWRDREPATYLEPFNLLHRNQMMENEPPEHTRLRRLVTGAFARGHVERLRPRVRELAASLLDAVDRTTSTSSVPTPSHCRCWSSPTVGGAAHPGAPAARLVAGHRADVRGRPVRDSCRCGRGRRPDFADAVRAVAAVVRGNPRDDLISDLVAARAGRPG